MRCPKCGADGAYVGFLTIECPNPHCSSFLETFLDPVRKAKKEECTECNVTDCHGRFPGTQPKRS